MQSSDSKTQRLTCSAPSGEKRGSSRPSWEKGWSSEETASNDFPEDEEDQAASVCWNNYFEKDSCCVEVIPRSRDMSDRAAHPLPRSSNNNKNRKGTLNEARDLTKQAARVESDSDSDSITPATMVHPPEQSPFERNNDSATSKTDFQELADTTSHCRRRLVSLIGCILILMVISIGLFLLVGSDEYAFRKNPSQHPNYQGTVSWSALQAHTVSEDCWVVYHDNVYDMTNYANEHPAGPEYITDFCGTDATGEYEMKHPKLLLNLIPETRLGVIVDDVDGEVIEATDATVAPDPGEESPDENWPSGKNDADDQGDDDTNDETENAAENEKTEPTEDTGNTAPPTEDGCWEQYYSLNDVAMHSDTFDCWYILFGVVYDLTTYADRHPGGSQRIFQDCGTDATSAFSNERKHDQSLLEKEGMSVYTIGLYGSQSGSQQVEC